MLQAGSKGALAYIDPTQAMMLAAGIAGMPPADEWGAPPCLQDAPLSCPPPLVEASSPQRTPADRIASPFEFDAFGMPSLEGVDSDAQLDGLWEGGGINTDGVLLRGEGDARAASSPLEGVHNLLQQLQIGSEPPEPEILP